VCERERVENFELATFESREEGKEGGKVNLMRNVRTNRAQSLYSPAITIRRQKESISQNEILLLKGSTIENNCYDLGSHHEQFVQYVSVCVFVSFALNGIILNTAICDHEIW
jgi:hypothetical protein